MQMDPITKLKGTADLCTFHFLFSMFTQSTTPEFLGTDCFRCWHSGGTYLGRESRVRQTHT